MDQAPGISAACGTWATSAPPSAHVEVNRSGGLAATRVRWQLVGHPPLNHAAERSPLSVVEGWACHRSSFGPTTSIQTESGLHTCASAANAVPLTAETALAVKTTKLSKRCRVAPS